jgi:hypothetical protein
MLRISYELGVVVHTQIGSWSLASQRKSMSPHLEKKMKSKKKRTEVWFKE